MQQGRRIFEPQRRTEFDKLSTESQSFRLHCGIAANKLSGNFGNVQHA